MTNNVTTKLQELNLLDRFLFDEPMDNLEEGKDREIIVDKLIKRFHLSEKEAAGYFEKYGKRQ